MDPKVVETMPEGTAGAVCYTCSLSDCGPPWVHTGVWVEQEGWVVLGEKCLARLADTVGYFTPQYQKALQTQIKNLKEKVEHLEPRAQAYEMVKERIGELATSP